MYFLATYFIDRDFTIIYQRVAEATQEALPDDTRSTLLVSLRRFIDRILVKVSMQIFLVNILALFGSLLVLARIASNITRPLAQLARETEKIGAGRYDDIHLEEMEERKDEIATLSLAVDEMFQGILEREKIRGVLNKVVSKDIAEEFLRSAPHLGGEDRVVSILFSDIRDFTHLSEDLTPQQTIEILNMCMTKMSRVIEGEGGVIDKYVGDEIMALYGAPIRHPDHALRAISSAMLMIETLKTWNKERRSQSLPVVEMGVGIHTGLVVAGNMGAEDRLNYTVIGANVNLAARLCQGACPLEILISKATLDEPGVADAFFVEPLEPIVFKGFSEAVDCYRVVGFRWDKE